MIKLTLFRIFTISLLLASWVASRSSTWQQQEDYFDNILYHFLKKNNFDSKGISKSPITILTVDSETIKKLGWPVPNETWNKVFKYIESQKYQVILNLLRFSQKDKDVLSKSMKHLNVIGSSLKLDKESAALNGPEEDFVSDKGLIYTDSSKGQELPIMPLSLEEDLEVASNYRKIGILPFFSESQRNNGFRMYRDLSTNTKKYSIPYSSYWALEDLLNVSFETSSGGKSDRFVQTKKISPLLFFGNPYQKTADYLVNQGIEKYYLIDIINGSQELPKNKLLILSADGMDQFYPGPSKKTFPPHIQDSRGDLVARAISEVYQETAVNSISGFTTEKQNLIILCLILILIVGTLTGREWLVFILACSSFAIHLYFATNNSHEIDIASIFDVNFFAITIIYLICLLTTESLRKSLMESIKLELSASLISCNKVTESEDVCIAKFKKKMLYLPLDLRIYQDKNEMPPTASLLFRLERSLFRFFRTFDKISHRQASELIQDLTFRSIDQINRRELETETLIKMKQISAKSEILGKFLSDSLVSRFSKSEALEASLAEIIQPKRQYAAILQADIRGFSRLTEKMSPEEVVIILQRYYNDIVNYSQAFAQVKLIGDAIFLFTIESSDQSACTRVFEAARILIESTKRENSLVDVKDRLHFGIALNYGEVVAGNVASNTCIDYTVIGVEVNKTARLEELTKDSYVSSQIGNYSLLVTRAMYENLPISLKTQVKWLRLAENRVKVRSFPDIEEIGYASFNGE
ncbi:MAG: adenylate/guanylate cyclase domain-containing protein [Pseudomonadota bacterium]